MSRKPSRKSQHRKPKQKPSRDRAAGKGGGAPTAYDILGLDRDAPPASVHERYRSLLRDHPPERDPDAFEQIRAAYEALADADRRRRYDQELRVGRTYDAVYVQALRLRAEEQWDLALNQARLALTIDRRSVDALMLQAECEEGLGRPDRAWNGVAHVLTLPGADSERIQRMLAWAKWGDNPIEQLGRLDRIVRRFPELGPRAVARARFEAYADLVQPVQAHRAFRQLLELRRPITGAMFDLYLEWLSASMMEYGPSVAMKRLRTHARRGFAPSFDRAEAKRHMAMLAKQAADEPDFPKQAMFIEIAHLLDPADRSLVSAWLEARDFADLYDEMGQAYYDHLLPPAVRDELWQSFCRFTGWAADRRPVTSPLREALWGVVRGAGRDAPMMSAAEFSARYPDLARRFGDALAPAFQRRKRR